jgi:hypothetical protein
MSSASPSLHHSCVCSSLRRPAWHNSRPRQRSGVCTFFSERWYHEEAFRIHKSDLKTRPIWHQKEDRVLAHIFVCFLAYVLWKTLGQLCSRAGLGDEPRRVLRELSEIRSMDVVLPTRNGPEIRTRCVAKPTDHQQILLDHLGLKLPAKINQRRM